MADLGSITAVRPTATTVTQQVTYGATIAAGQCVYLDTNDNEYKLADSDLTAITAAAKGIAITPGVDAGKGLIAKAGSIILVGTTMVIGETYLASKTAGGIMPVADAATGTPWITYLGNAASATQLDIILKATANVHA